MAGRHRAAIAAAIALRQLRSQQDVILRQTEQLERKQASKIEVTLAPTTLLEHQVPTWSVEVRNGSRRPIRRLECGMSTSLEGSDLPDQIGKWIDGTSGTAEFRKLRGHDFWILRPGAAVVFVFPIDVEAGQAEESGEEIPVPYQVRFEDDVGLPWEIDQDLHLSRGERRIYRPSSSRASNPGK